MKKLGLRLASAFIGFILGVCANWVWGGGETTRSSASPQPLARRGWETPTWSSASPQTLPYCQVARNGEYYHNQIIRVRARLLLDSGAIYIYEDCHPVSALASLVQIDGAAKSDISDYVGKFLVEGGNSSNKQVDAVIEGRFNAKFSPGCWVAKYEITAYKITPTN